MLIDVRVSLTAFVLFILSGCFSNVDRGIATTGGAADRLVGTWQLVSIAKNSLPDSKRGEHPIGLIYYDRTGHMTVQIVPDPTLGPTFAKQGDPTPEEAKAAFTGYTGYFGTYTVNETDGTITHHRVGNIDPSVPVDRVRRFEFSSPDQLVLIPMEDPDVHLTWQQMK